MRSTVTVVPDVMVAISSANCRASPTGALLTVVMTSPLFMPVGHRRAIGLRLGDKRTGRLFQPHGVDNVRRDRLDFYAEPAARHDAPVVCKWRQRLRSGLRLWRFPALQSTLRSIRR
jgi:hypothetical protein